jgi:hypothetical protein
MIGRAICARLNHAIESALMMSADDRIDVDARSAGSFRTDLFYRLASIPIVMPTLRQRRSDRRADRALCRNLQPRILPESVLAGRQRERRGA